MPVQVIIKKSTNPKKKLMAVFYLHKGGRKIKTTHFGQAGAPDFTTTKDEERKKRYLTRHKANENWQDYKSAGSLSRWILWDKSTRSASIKAYKRRFNLV